MCTSTAPGLDGLDAVLDQLAGDAAADLSDLALVHRVQALHRQVLRLQALLLRDIAAVHARGAAAADGFASTQALLRRRLRLDARTATRQVAVAVAVEQLPDTAAALAAGEVSTEHAAAIGQSLRDLGPDVLAGGGERLLLAEAREEAPARVWRLGRLLRERLDPPGADEQERRRFRDRWLDTARTWRGMVSVQGMLDPVTGELLMAALAAYTPPPSPSTGGPALAADGAAAGDVGDEVRTAGQRRADGLADLCRTALGAADTPSAVEHRPQVTVTVSLETLRGNTSDGIPAGPDQHATGRGIGHSADRGAADHRAADHRADRGVADRGVADRSAADRSAADRSAADRSAADLSAGHEPGRGRGRGGSRGLGHAVGGCGGAPARSLSPGAEASGGAKLGAAAEPVCPSTARRLACEAGVIPVVLGGHSEPLDIGRLTRVVPTGLRRALDLRDRGCRFPGCDRPPPRTQAHHIQHWARNGPTSLHNLVLLCAFHHWLVHEGRWSLYYAPRTDTLSAYRPGGTRYDLASGPAP